MIVHDGFVAPDGQPAAKSDADAESSGNDTTDAQIADRGKVVLGKPDPVAQGSDQEQRKAIAVHATKLEPLVIPSMLLPR